MDIWTHPEVIAAIVAGVGAIVTVIVGGIKSLFSKVEHILAELKPNGGSSIKDQVNRLEQNQKTFMDEQLSENKRNIEKFNKIENKVDKMYDIILEKLTGE